ncbi:MAG: hypothetical protein H7Z42_13100 [Roseiflexaceae bacterium]|nr:hypothetical protein [Roseiflexaceae bacterium]
MSVDVAAAEHVRELRAAGLRPSDTRIRTILKSGDAAFAPLLALATNLALLDEDEPELFAPLHALRLLGELPKVDMILPILREFPIDIHGEWDEIARSWANEVPTIIGRLGAVAIAPLWAAFDDETLAHEGQAVAMLCLNCAATFDPHQREPLIGKLRERLAIEQDATKRTHLVIGLANFGLASDYPQVLSLYREGRLDTQALPASVARQLLLSGGEKGMRWTNLSLAERYEQLGPLP